MGPGVGISIVINSTVYDGRHYKAAELGHYIVKKDRKECYCRRKGCLEMEVSYSTLSRYVDFTMNNFGQVYTELKREKSIKCLALR